MNATSTSPIDVARHNLQQALTFCLGDEHFGVEILRVQEIRGWSKVTEIPEAPPHVLGVLNLRGAIVPIVDLRLRLGLARVEYTPLTVIIVLSVEAATGRRDFGIVVDRVSDVTDLSDDQLKAPPDLGARVNTDYIRALAALTDNMGDRMVMLLDIDRLLLADTELQLTAA